MKTLRLLTLLLILACTFTNCSDSDKDIDGAIKPPTEKEQKNDKDEIELSNNHSIVKLKTLSGSTEGAVEGANKIEFIKALEKVNEPVMEQLKKTSIRFIKNTDRLMLKGHIHNLIGVSSSTPVEKEMEYMFVDGKLIVILTDGGDRSWYTYGYGTKDKIDVYVDLKTVIYNEKEENNTPWFENDYSIESITATMYKENIESSVSNWKVFFDNISSWLPYSTCHKSKDEMKHPSQGVAWSIHKFTIHPTEIEK